MKKTIFASLLICLLALPSFALAGVYNFSGTFTSATGGLSTYSGSNFLGTLSFAGASPATGFDVQLTVPGSSTIIFNTASDFKFLTPATIDYTVTPAGTSSMYSMSGYFYNKSIAKEIFTLDFVLAPGGTGTVTGLYSLTSFASPVGTKGATFNASVSTATTPIPAAFLLLGSGLAGLVGVGRRFRKN